MVRAGDYREKIRIEVRTGTQNAEGEPYNTWTTLATVRCAIQRQNGRETFEAHQREGRVSTIFRIRYSSQVSTISPAMRLVLISNNAVYNIISAVDQGGRREEILIVAEEHVGETAGPDGGPYVPPVVTLDADKVNVSAISGLSADDAQGAFAELVAADTTLQGNIDAEAASRGDADDLLDGRVTANEADIASLQTDLATEQTTRADADSALDGRVTDAESQLVAADENTQGFVSKVAQTFAGLKTFVAGIALQAKLTITGVAAGSTAIEIPSGALLSLGNAARPLDYTGGMFRSRAGLNLEGTAGSSADFVRLASGGVVWLLWIPSASPAQLRMGGAGTSYFWNGTFAGAGTVANEFRPPSPTTGKDQVVVQANGRTGQTGDLQQWAVDGSVLSKVTKDGTLENPTAGAYFAIAKSPNGTRFGVSVANDGTLVTTAL